MFFQIQNHSQELALLLIKIHLTAPQISKLLQLYKNCLQNQLRDGKDFHCLNLVALN